MLPYSGKEFEANLLTSFRHGNRCESLGISKPYVYRLSYRIGEVGAVAQRSRGSRAKDNDG